MWVAIKKWKWILSALFCFLLLYILPSETVEQYYSRGIFLHIRHLLDVTFGKLPFPSYYLFLAFLAIAALKWIAHFFKEKPGPFLHRLFKLISFTGFMTTAFFIIWGFNYGRYPLSKSLGLIPKPLTKNELENELKLTAEHLAQIRNKIHNDTSEIPQIAFINTIEEKCTNSLNVVLTDFGFPTSRVRGRFVQDDMFLLFNIGGQYLPFVGEANVDDAVYCSKKPFYLIHEMAHGNGFTSESDCNFLAYVSCIHSQILPLQYSGELNYLMYLLEDYRDRDELAAAQFGTTMPTIIQKDLKDIRDYYLKHTFKTAIIGEMINNIYLKTLRVQEGTKSYNKMILLVHAWKQKNQF